MNFFSKLFSSQKDDSPQKVVVEEHTEPKSTTIEIDAEPEPNTIDKYGWHKLPNGVKLKNDPDMKGTLHEIFQKDISELGYNGGELYPKDNLNTNPFIVGYFQLFTDKLIGVSRNDEIKMTTSEINNFVKEYGRLTNSEEEDLLEEGVNNNNISQNYIETILQKKSIDDKLETEKFSLHFKNGVLANFQRIDKYSADARDYLYISGYYNEAKKWHHDIEDNIVKEINFQAECFLHMDLNIVRSLETKEAFSYPNGCYNYIAMAAYYKCYDVQIEDFINSTHGSYEYISREAKNGEEITKIKAYNKIYTFINGHSKSTCVVDLSNKRFVDTEMVENGYVYVMVNPSIPDMVKIGMTTKDPNERAKELSSATGVPTPFMLVYYKPFKNCYLTEQRIHQYLESKGYRVKNNREFFNMPTNLAINVVQAYYELEQEEIEKSD